MINSGSRTASDDDGFTLVRPIGIAVGIGAVLGHHRVVRYAVQTLRANWQAPIVISLQNGGEASQGGDWRQGPRVGGLDRDDQKLGRLWHSLLLAFQSRFRIFV